MRKTFKVMALAAKWLLVFLAAGNLIALFGFHYRIPGFLSPMPPQARAGGSTALDTPDAGDSADAPGTLLIIVPDQPLLFDGSGTLDLMEGVQVQNSSGEEVTQARVYSSIKQGDSRLEKVIEYAVSDEEGNRSTAQRTVRITGGYSGPFILLEGEIPDMSDSDLNNALGILKDNHLIRADDGFGNDITDAVTSAVKRPSDDSDECIITLSVTNLLNDSYSTELIVYAQEPGPKLRLTTDQVTISAGAEFSFYPYISVAEDEEGNSLWHSIRVNGEVDVNTPGEYVLEFFCVDAQGNSSPVRTLTVTVTQS